ncbi:MAG TPA: hypothetical protein VHK28_01000 [Candidatus Limnocylindria bacterium]|nr:hypothetical protein [Candidatus Limnocylindria bacterium]
MRRSLAAATVVVVGLLLLVDFVIINPLLVGAAGAVLELVVLLAAAAAVAGAVALVLRHWTELVERRGDPLGSLVLLTGFTVMLLAGLYPGSDGAADPAVRWLVAALMAPLAAALFSLLFVFLLGALGQGIRLHGRRTAVMLVAAALVVMLLLPLGGPLGDSLAAAASWALAVPIGGVFRGLLIGVGIITALQATRVILAVDGADD